jgi:hypothetical protein
MILFRTRPALMRHKTRRHEYGYFCGYFCGFGRRENLRRSMLPYAESK